MRTKIIARFIGALRGVEDYGDPSLMVELFNDDADLSSPGRPPLSGKKGVIEFWNRYLSVFKEVHTRFEKIFEHGNGAVLEWTADARLLSGRRVAYDGATVIETRDGRISRLKAYYDPGVFHEGFAHPIATTEELMHGEGRAETSTPGDGVLTSSPGDMDTATD